MPEAGDARPDVNSMPSTDNTSNVRPPRDSAERPLADDKTTVTADYSGFRASELIGATVENARGENVGEINDIILGQDGNANAALIGVGGFLGLGEKNVAVQFSELNISEKNGDLAVSIAMSAEALEAMPAYKSDTAKKSEPAEQSQPKTEMKQEKTAPEGNAQEPKTKL